MTFGVEKPEWCDYPVAKNFEDMLIRLDTVHGRDRQTNRQTDGRRMTA